MGEHFINKSVFTDEYYRRVMSEHGYDAVHHSLGEINFTLGPLQRQDLSTKYLCHHNADVFAERYNRGENSMVCTGIGLSGIPHIGTIMQIQRAIFLQKSGIPVQLILGDLDAQNGKGTDAEKTEELAEKYREFILLLGFKDEQPSILRSQDPRISTHPEEAMLTLLTMYQVGKYMEDKYFKDAIEELHGVYAARGKVNADPAMSYSRRLSLNLMIADFAYHILYKNTRNILVSLGLDEHIYVQAAQRGITNMMRQTDNVSQAVNVAGIYTPMITGLFGEPKMSKSLEKSGLYADMEQGQIEYGVMYGEFDKQGARAVDPRDNPIYQVITSLDECGGNQSEYLYNVCLSGGTEWNEAKETLVVALLGIFSKWPK